MDGFFNVFKMLPREERLFFKRYLEAFYPDAEQLRKGWTFAEQHRTEEQVDDAMFYRYVWDFADTTPVSNKQIKKAQTLWSDLKRCLIEALTARYSKSIHKRPDIRMLQLEALSLDRETFGAWHDKALKSIKADLNTEPEDRSLDMWDYFSRLKVAHYDYYQVFNARNYTPRFDNIRELLDNLFCFYIAGRCKYAAEAWERKFVTGEEHSALDTDDIIAFTEEMLHKSPKSLKFYLDLLKLACDKYTDTEFDALQKQVLDKTQKPNEETIILCKSLINAAGRAINRGNNAYLQKAFDLTIFGIENNLLLVNGLLLVEVYLNMVSIGTTLKQFKDTEFYVQRFANKLPKEAQKNTTAFAKAKLNFEQQKYPETLTYLAKIDDSNIEYAIRVRLMYVQCYFELNDDRVDKEMVNFKQFVSRNVGGKNPKQGVNNFLAMVKKLLDYKCTKAEMFKYLSDKQNIFCRAWLTEKVEQSKDHRQH
jgi:tetratricopeptide (TPR) repeat protein